MDALQSSLPGWLRNTEFLLANWQWLALLVLGALCVILDKTLVFGLARIVGRWYERQHIELDPRERARLARPFGLTAAAGLWLAGLTLLGLPPMAHKILAFAGLLVLCLGGIWAAFKLIDLISAYLARLAAGTDTHLDDILVPMLSKTLKVFAVGFGLVFIADNLDIDMASLLAGMGLGGLAFALAAKDMVANIFGSITVLADRPFKIGDWIHVNGVDGTVEDIGLRTIKLRTFYNSLVTMPNSILTSSKIDNYGRRQYRRIKSMISVTYDTPPETMEAFCEGIRELIRRHPYTRKDYFHVYFNEFGAASLNVLLYCFVETPDWSTELREKHRLFVDIVRLAARLGVEFAFPTQTIHLAREAAAASPIAPPADATAAEVLGREQAQAIVTETLGPEPDTPPPVSFT